MIDLADVWFTQKSLKRKSQIEKLKELLAEGKPFSGLIQINEAPDGELEIHDGHHRVTAIWLTGRHCLTPDECLVVPSDKCFSRFRRCPEAIPLLLS